MFHWKNKTSARDNETQYDFIFKDGYSQNLGGGDMYVISL